MGQLKSQRGDQVPGWADADTYALIEGDVVGIMSRPADEESGSDGEREKWYVDWVSVRPWYWMELIMGTRDAWHEQNGISRTEAKRRYISLLIETMHKYASTTPYVVSS